MTTRSVANHRNKRNGKVESKAATVDAATLDTATQEAVTVVTPEAAPAPPANATAVAAPAATVTQAPAPVATEAPTQPVEPPKPPVEPALQSQAIQEFLVEADDRLAGLEEVGEPLASLLPANGITDERLAAVRDLYDATQNAVTDRGGAMVTESTATIAMQRGFRQATIGMSALRQIGRTLFADVVADRDARLALQLDKPLPDRIPIFVDRGRAVLAAARQEAHAPRLAAGGYDSQRIDALAALLDALDLLYRERRQAHQAAINATTTRNATVGELRTAMRQLRVEVAAVLRAHPEVNPPADF